jgi:hypothetical protein
MEGGGGEGGEGAHVAWMLVAHLSSVIDRVHFLIVAACGVSSGRCAAVIAAALQ